MLRKIFFILLAGVLLISFSACSSTEGTAEEKNPVVAIVNDKEIQRVDFENMVDSMKLSYQQFGIDFTSEEGQEILALIEAEALSNLIQQQLLLQDALEKQYEVSKDEIDAEVEQIKSQFDNEEEFLAALEINQLTLAMLEESIANEIMLLQYVQNEISDPVVTEEELLEMYDEYSLMMEDVPSFKEIKPELEEELKYEKFQISLEELIGSLEAKSNIEIFL